MQAFHYGWDMAKANVRGETLVDPNTTSEWASAGSLSCELWVGTHYK